MNQNINSDIRNQAIGDQDNTPNEQIDNIQDQYPYSPNHSVRGSPSMKRTNYRLGKKPSKARIPPSLQAKINMLTQGQSLLAGHRRTSSEARSPDQNKTENHLQDEIKEIRTQIDNITTLLSNLLINTKTDQEERSREGETNENTESEKEQRRYNANERIIVQSIDSVKPPKFDGNEEEAITWLLSYKEIADTNGWSEITKLKQVRLALTYTAKSWYRSQWGCERPESWEEFEEVFNETYVHEDIGDLMRYKLNELTQKRGQHLLDYYHTALELCTLAGNKLTMKEKVKFIIKGMLPEARRAIKMTDPRNILDLRRAITNWIEEDTQKYYEIKENYNQQRPRQMNSYPIRESRTYNRNFTYQRPQETQQQTQEPRRDIWCLNCGKQGHGTRSCPEPHNPDVVRRRKNEWNHHPKYLNQEDKGKPTNRQVGAVLENPHEEPNEQISRESACSVIIKKRPPEINPPEFPDKIKVGAFNMTKTNKRSSKITCRVNGQLEEAIADTGATITVLPLALAQRTNTDIYEWEWRNLQMANGITQKPIGWCRASVDYRERIHTINAVVFKEAPELLLGEDYHEKAGIVISYPDKLTTYHDEFMRIKSEFNTRTRQKTTNSTTQTEDRYNKEITANSIGIMDTPQEANEYYIEYIEKDEPKLNINRVSWENTTQDTKSRGLVRAKRRVALPPRTKARIEVKISGTNIQQGPFIFEPDTHTNIIAIPGITKHRSGIIDVINITKLPVTIEKRQFLGKIHHIGDDNHESISNTQETVGNEDKRKLSMLLEEFKDLFVTEDTAIGIVPFLKHRIITGEEKPIKLRPYRVSIAEQRIIQKLIDDMLAADIIRPSRSPWASPIVLVKKKDTTDLRFCVDYRKLNKITTVDPYPIPNMESVLEVLSGNHYFSKLDVKAMYWQVLMEEGSREKTAFVVHCGQYEFNVMPFGLISAPMTAMRVMNEITRGMNDTTFVFYDDILVFTPTIERHLEVLRDLFERFNKANIKLNAKKCHLLLNSVKYLGHEVKPEGIKPDPEKIKAIQSFKRPANITEARSFIGMCNFFRRFIKGFAAIARPIHDTIKGDKTFEWTDKAQEAMEDLKHRLSSPPVLIHYDPGGELTIRCDASGYGLGAVLMQSSQNKMKNGVIAYTSRTLIAAEINYATTHKECLAVVHAIKQWRHYLYGTHFTVITDHHALCWLMKTKEHTGRLMRWALLLQEYDFEIKYESGKLHADADCLSRAPLKAGEEAKGETHIPTWPIHAVKNSKSTYKTHLQDELFVPNYNVPAEQTEDKFCKDIIDILRNEHSPKKLKRKHKAYKLIEGKLYKESRAIKGRLVLVLPHSMIKFVLNEAHDKPIGGHFGIRRTLQIIKERFYWPTLEQDVTQYVRTCDSCQKRKANNTRKRGLLIPMTVPHAIFEILGMDLIGPLPQSREKHSYILVITDYLSKYVIIKPLKKTTSEKIMETLKKHLFYVYGIPKRIITDNGSNLTSKSMRNLFEFMNIEHKTTSPYRPQTNGQTERYNRVLGTQLAIFAKGKHSKWDRYLDALAFAYNTSIHSSHNNSPFYLVFGRDPIKPLDTAMGEHSRKILQRDTLVKNELKVLNIVRKQVRDLIRKGQLKMKEIYDKDRKLPEFKLGDLVLKRKPFISGDRKFKEPYYGPFEIKRQLNDVNYHIINNKDSNEELIVHCTQIKPYNQRRLVGLEGEICNE